MSLVPDDAPKPRHVHLRKWPDFAGYGFNLHAEKGKSGQYIGKVDEASPAEAAGLKQNDRIVEVNGVNIGNENHQQVVSRIRAGGEETKLLVVDAETDSYYKGKNIVVRGEMPNVLFLETPVPRPSTVNGTAQEVEAEVNHQQEPQVTQEAEAVAAVAAVSVAEETPVTNGTAEEQASQNQSEPEPEPTPVSEPEPQPETVIEQSSSPVVTAEEVTKEEVTVAEAAVVSETLKSEPEPAPEAAEPLAPPPAKNADGSLNLSMSLAEAREMVSKRSRRKHEVKSPNINMKEKFDLFQRL